MKYYMKVCIYADDFCMNNLLMNYYMNAYVELTWWLCDVTIKWWIITWMFICWWTMIWNAYVELTWRISMRL